MSEQRCATCRYARPRDGQPTYVCARFPPTVAGEVTVWPVVNADDWCGEWQAKEAGLPEKAKPAGKLSAKARRQVVALCKLKGRDAGLANYILKDFDKGYTPAAVFSGYQGTDSYSPERLEALIRLLWFGRIAFNLGLPLSADSSLPS